MYEWATNFENRDSFKFIERWDISDLVKGNIFPLDEIEGATCRAIIRAGILGIHRSKNSSESIVHILTWPDPRPVEPNPEFTASNILLAVKEYLDENNE